MITMRGIRASVVAVVALTGLAVILAESFAAVRMVEALVGK